MPICVLANAMTLVSKLCSLTQGSVGMDDISDMGLQQFLNFCRAVGLIDPKLLPAHSCDHIFLRANQDRCASAPPLCGTAF